jgi:uncharacterized protein YqgC (DUF456 family)
MLMLVGLFGLIVPVFPGLVVMWLAALGYGVASGSLPWHCAVRDLSILMVVVPLPTIS